MADRFNVATMAERMGCCKKTIYNRLKLNPETLPPVYREGRRYYFLESEYAAFLKAMAAVPTSLSVGLRKGGDQLWRPFVDSKEFWLGAPQIEPEDALDELRLNLYRINA